MPLFLRRRDTKFEAYLVVNAEGYKVGVILNVSHRVAEPAPQWEWHINGEIVAQLVNASGQAHSLDEAKAELARNWRRWLELKGLPEDHRPMFG